MLKILIRASEVPNFYANAFLTIVEILIAYAAASDLLTMRLPNWLTAATAASFLVIAPVFSLGWPEIGMNAACAALVLAGGFACFAMGWIGGGDAKFAAAAAIWLGFQGVMEFLLVGALLGAALTLLILQARRWPLPARLHGEAWIARLHGV